MLEPARLDDPKDPLVGRVIQDDLRLEEVVGQGAMARVYRARQLRVDRDVAVKVLHSSLLHDAILVARFQREAIVAARIRHPHVIEVIGAGELPRESPEKPGEPYLVVEFLHGPSLRTALGAAGGAFPLPRALHVVLQICDAMGEAHELGIVHRDLKPENVMLVQRGDDPDFVKLLDFGLSRQSGADPGFETRAGSVLGTARYVSPEGARGDPVGPAADVYSIATILFECLVGRTPFDAENPVALLVRRTQHTAMDVRSVPRGADVPGALAALLADSLARDVSRRPRNARDFGRRLFAAATESGLAASELLPRSTLLGTRSAPRPAALATTTGPAATPDPAALAEPSSAPPAAPVTVSPRSGRRSPRQRPMNRVAVVATCFALGALGALGIATGVGSCERGGR
ncbi:MAG TPA: serine/threonine-protein kinase [Polyangiaceae bacterium]